MRSSHRQLRSIFAGNCAVGTGTTKYTPCPCSTCDKPLASRESQLRHIEESNACARSFNSACVSSFSTSNSASSGEIGRAHVCTPVTTAQLVCRLLLEKKQLTITYQQHQVDLTKNNTH